jgi:hypothetical protein
MAVGLSDEQATACQQALFPVEVVRTNDVKEAQARVASVLPLVVIVDSTMSEDHVKSLEEYVSACGAQIVAIKGTPERAALQTDLLDAIFEAEQRRSAPPT